MRNYFIILMPVMLLAACVNAPRPQPSLFADVEAAIQRAVDAGAEQSAPVELRFARERLRFVREVAMPAEDYELAGWRLNEALLDAQLAYIKARSASARDEAAAARSEAERLRGNIVEAFGEDALTEGQP